MASRARRGVRREGRLGAGRLLRVERGTRRCESLRPRGWAGRALVAGDRRRAPGAPASAAGLFDESSFAKIEVSGPDAAQLPGVGLRQPGRAGGRRRDLHPGAEPSRRHRVRLHRHPTGRRRVPDRHRHRVRHARHGLAAQAGPAPPRPTCGSPTSPGIYCCFALWGPRARDILSRLTPADLSDAAFPFMTAQRADGRRRAGAGAAGDLRRRARLGALRVAASTAPALWETLWAAGADDGLVAGGYRAIDSMRLEKGYRVWGSDLTARDRRRTRPGSASA